ncbi:hypothetical protein NQ318_016980 [Aromia moschata]|uniref:DNA fragmentation factor 40 C-terminal domain-containing protein n=1 Tax=Aromia moschata TaxID=1265417 RepID=A0AAV8YEP7_9CUCU|nr:hypothetical protein NQ318_016980 [Aromia moschata]
MIFPIPETQLEIPSPYFHSSFENFKARKSNEASKKIRNGKTCSAMKGLDTNAKTKEEYMFRRAQDRIRMYFYKTKEELLKTKRLAAGPAPVVT